VSSTIGTPFGNASGYSNATVDQLALDGQSAPTQAERADFYKQIQVIIADDLPNLLIHERTAYDAASRRLMGLWNNHVGYGDWAHAWLQTE
jgi:peptide/nickel transport system substrate-binding protein